MCTRELTPSFEVFDLMALVKHHAEPFDAEQLAHQLVECFIILVRIILMLQF